MMKRTGRGLALLLALMLLLAQPVTALAEGTGGPIGDSGLSWTLDSDGVLTVEGSGAIPDYEKGAAQPWKGVLLKIRAVRIGDGVTRIGDRAFQSCKRLETLSLGGNVKSIGQWAFQNCYALQTVEGVPEGLSPEKGAFRSTPVEWDMSARMSEAYRGSAYCQALTALQPGEDLRENVLAVAKAQIGYHEGDSPADYDGANQNGTQDFTEFGQWLDSPGGAWCSEFASWCIRLAGVPWDMVANSRSANAEGFTDGTDARYYAWADTVYAGGSFQPRKGDIILFAEPGSEIAPGESLKHTALLEEELSAAGGTVQLRIVHGNSGDRVKENEILLAADSGMLQTGDNQIAYFVAPAYDKPVTRWTLRFDPRGGSVSPAYKSVAEGSVYGVLPLPQRPGFVFDGWYTAPEGGERVEMGSRWNETADQTLYAHWK